VPILLLILLVILIAQIGFWDTLGAVIGAVASPDPVQPPPRRHARRGGAARVPAGEAADRPGRSMIRPRLTIWHALAIGLVIVAWAMWNVLLA
jgi:hypothetical protein